MTSAYRFSRSMPFPLQHHQVGERYPLTRANRPGSLKMKAEPERPVMMRLFMQDGKVDKAVSVRRNRPQKDTFPRLPMTEHAHHPRGVRRTGPVIRPMHRTDPAQLHKIPRMIELDIVARIQRGREEGGRPLQKNPAQTHLLQPFIVYRNGQDLGIPGGFQRKRKGTGAINRRPVAGPFRCAALQGLIG
ncbi:hypothetical protein N6H14_14965 [Paenibacillus sp. CC-CFT747]|nr:hypothetical protein N6H14_14965 [Paenibacillus sp. CC-CFT747]